MNKFKIIHWNALADSLSDGFPFVSKTYLEWGYRKDLIIEKVMKENADIICLVEIDQKHQTIFDGILPNYRQIYVKKDSDDNQEGCMILINTARFEILDITPCKLLEGRSQIAIIMKLIDRYGEHVFNLVSTHLKAKPGFENIRLSQCQTIIQHLDNSIDTIFVGDFNDIPGSLCYDYLTRDCKFMDTYINRGQEYTTFKKREKVVCRVIDYIFYKSDRLKVDSIVDAPRLEDIPEIGLPSEKHPSDHVLLGVTFR